MTKQAILFPGQGAQFKGMGAELFKAYPQLTQQANEILGYDLVKLCLEDPQQKLNQTQYTQPALYVVNALGFYQRQSTEKLVPDFALGHSLGEYNALLAADAFDFVTGLRLIQKRGELMGQASGGAMVAVIGPSPDDTMDIIKKEGLETIEPANYNTPTQLVIAGPTDDVDQAVDILRGVGASVVPLPVSAAFHSSYMKEAQEAFARYISTFSFNGLRFPVLANTTAEPYDAQKIGQTLSRQIVSPVKWVNTIRYLIRLGNIDYIEINSRILSNMVVQITKG